MRIYYTAHGASEAFARLGLGNPAGPRNNVDLAFLAPDGRNIDVRTLKPLEGSSREGAWVRDIVAREKNAAGDGEEIVATTVELMKKLVQLHPAKREAPSVPWQVSLGHAVFVSAWDSQFARKGGPRDPRRIVVAPGPVEALEDADLLRRFERHYVFVRVDPKDAPAGLKAPLERGSVVVLDLARSVDGFGQKQDPATRSYPKVLAEGAPTKSALAELLKKHVAPAETRP